VHSQAQDHHRSDSTARDRGASARRVSAGQSLVEFALMLPVVMLVVLLTIDVGRLYYGWVNLQNAARIGANYAASHPTAWGAAPDAGAQAEYARQIRDEAAAINCVLPSSVPAPTFVAGGATSLGEARVDLTCRFDVITPKLVGVQTLRLASSAVFPVRTGTITVVPPPPPPPPTPPPAPTPTPPEMCTVPALLGTVVDDAASTWAGAGFDVSNLNISLGTGNYTIRSEAGGDLGQMLVPGSYDSHSENCMAFVLTVGP
jgi:TadE-like protein